GRRPELTGTQLALPAREGAARAAAVFVPCAPGRDLAGEVSEAAAAAGGRPVLAEVTVSVGRTAAEARARADADELFTLAGHPAQQGLFGTLEECQAAAARLGRPAHHGLTAERRRNVQNDAALVQDQVGRVCPHWTCAPRAPVRIADKELAMAYETRLASLASYEKCGVEVIDDDPKN